MLTTYKMKLLAVAAVGIGIAACSSSSSPGTGDTTKDGSASSPDGGSSGGPMSLSDFCSGVLTAIATLESKCEGGSVADWEAAYNMSGVNTCAELAAAKAAGRLKYDDSQSSACLSAYDALTCSYFASEGSEPASCIAALAGTVAKGGTCYSDDDCAGAPGTYCDIVSTGSAQVCSGKCAAYLAAGATCTGMTTPCAAGYSCVTKAGSTTQVCTATPVAKAASSGQTCGYDVKTMVTTPCDTGLVCNETTLKCIAQAEVGDSCASYAYACAYFTYCDATTKKCVADAASGAPCSASVTCGTGLTCKMATGATTGTCSALVATGGACTGDQDCVSGSCGTDMKCVAPCSEL